MVRRGGGLGLFLLRVFVGGVLEIADASSDATADIRQSVGAEDQNDDEQDDKQLGDTEVGHGGSFRRDTHESYHRTAA